MKESLSFKMRYAAKMVFSVVLALLLANLICYFFYSPAIQVPNVEEYTNLKNVPGNHNPHSGGEGLGNAIIDENGFNNLGFFPFEKAKTLCMGSSQTEGQNVQAEETYVSLLNKRHSDINAYNLGVSAASFEKMFFRIGKLKQKFPEAETIIFEINSIPDLDSLKRLRTLMENNDIVSEDISWKNGNIFVKTISEIPLCRLLWHKTATRLKELKKADNNKAEIKEVSGEYHQVLDDIMRLAKEQSGDTKIIIMTLDFLEINNDGTASVINDNGEREIFAKVCKANGIKYVSTGSAFLRMYTEQHQLPNGFLDSQLGVGHLNVYGHEAIADLLVNILVQEDYLVESV